MGGGHGRGHGRLRPRSRDGGRDHTPLVQEARQLVEQLPHYLQHAHDRSSLIGRLDERVHLQQRITEMVSGSGRFTFAGIVRTGSEVFGVLSHVGIVAMLTIYFLADMRRIRAGFYRLLPNSRRPRAILIGDEVVAKFGAYLFGNVLTSVIAGFATFVWCVLLDVPYAVLLGLWSPSWTCSPTAQPLADSSSQRSRSASRSRSPSPPSPSTWGFGWARIIC